MAVRHAISDAAREWLERNRARLIPGELDRLAGEAFDAGRECGAATVLGELRLLLSDVYRRTTGKEPS